MALFIEDTFQGWLAAPLTWFIASFFWCLLSWRGFPILAGGIGVALVAAFVVVLLVCFWAIAMSVNLLFSRLGLMPHSVWSKKKQQWNYCTGLGALHVPSLHVLPGLGD